MWRRLSRGTDTEEDKCFTALSNQESRWTFAIRLSCCLELELWETIVTHHWYWDTCLRGSIGKKKKNCNTACAWLQISFTAVSNIQAGDRTQCWAAHDPRILQELQLPLLAADPSGLGLWFLKTYPRSTRKTVTLIPSPTSLETIILWLEQNDVTWTRWLRFSAPADLSSLAWIGRICCCPSKQGTVKLSFRAARAEETECNVYVFHPICPHLGGGWVELMRKPRPRGRSFCSDVIINNRADCGATLSFSSGRPLAFTLSTSTYCTQSWIFLAPVQTHTHMRAHTCTIITSIFNIVALEWLREWEHCNWKRQFVIYTYFPLIVAFKKKIIIILP